MLLHQQIQDNMLDEEVVSFGQRAQHQQDQQQLQLRQHNIPHNPVYPKQVMSPKRPNVEAPNQGGPPGPEALYQQNNLLQQVVHLEWDQGLREIVQNNNSSIEQIVAEVRRINHSMGQITGGLNNAFGQVRTDAQNQRQGMASFHEQLVDVHRKLGILEKEATRLQHAEIGGLKERCKKIEQESVRTDRKWQSVHEQLQKIPELERELRASNQKIANLERKLSERDGSPRANVQQLVEKMALMEKRLKEAGISTEQLGQHELIREIHRIQVWIQSLNGGWSPNTIHPDAWTNPVTALEKRCIQLQAQYEGLALFFRFYRPKFRDRLNFRESNPLGLNPVQSIRIGLNQFQLNPIQVNWINPSPMEFNPSPIQWTPIHLDPIQWTPIHSDPIQWTPVKLDQLQ